MEQSTFAIIVLLGALVMYMIPKIPLAMTAMTSMLIMGFAGCCTWSEAFGGFSNNAVLLSASMMIIGQACVSTGLAVKLGNLLYKFVKSEKIFITMVLAISVAMSVFINGALTVAIMMPIIDSIVLKSGGTLTRKSVYLPLGIGSTIGNNVTTIGATSMITCVALLVENGFEEMSLFEPTLVNLPAIIVVIIVFALFGDKLQKRWYDFEEMPLLPVKQESAVETPEAPVWKMYLTAAVLIGVIVAIIAGVNYGAAPMVGVVILILTGCIKEKDAYRGVSWSTIILIAAAIGFSAGFKNSGAGEVIAKFFINVAGPLGQTGFGMCIVMFVVSTLLSNLMMDNATIAIVAPISIAIGATLGVDALPIVLCAASGTKVGIATPMSVTPMAMVQIPGYRFKDYLRCGGLVNIICCVVTLIMVYFVYYA